jgi:hypothetical protein
MQARQSNGSDERVVKLGDNGFVSHICDLATLKTLRAAASQKDS